jgi:hypothetical protein
MSDLREAIVDVLESYFRYTLRVELDEDIPACADAVLKLTRQATADDFMVEVEKSPVCDEFCRARLREIARRVGGGGGGGQ